MIAVLSCSTRTATDVALHLQSLLKVSAVLRSETNFSVDQEIMALCSAVILSLDTRRYTFQ